DLPAHGRLRHVGGLGEDDLLGGAHLVPHRVGDRVGHGERAEACAVGRVVDDLLEAVRRDAQGAGEGALDGAAGDGLVHVPQGHGDAGRVDLVDHAVGGTAGGAHDLPVQVR